MAGNYSRAALKWVVAGNRRDFGRRWGGGAVGCGGDGVIGLRSARAEPRFIKIPN